MLASAKNRMWGSISAMHLRIITKLEYLQAHAPNVPKAFCDRATLWSRTVTMFIFSLTSFEDFVLNSQFFQYIPLGSWLFGHPVYCYSWRTIVNRQISYLVRYFLVSTHHSFLHNFAFQPAPEKSIKCFRFCCFILFIPIIAKWLNQPFPITHFKTINLSSWPNNYFTMCAFYPRQQCKPSLK